MHHIPRLEKIPGALTRPAISNKEKDGYIQDLNKLTKPQLFELRDRQLTLLSNKKQLSKLPDKGKRIQDFYEKIARELAYKSAIDIAADQFSQLNIAKKGERAMTNLEWTGAYDPDKGEPVLDSDDEEETDPLKILAQNRNATKQIKFMKPDKSLITESDINEMKIITSEGENNSTQNDDLVSMEELTAATLVSVEIRDTSKLKKYCKQKPSESDESRSTSSLSTHSDFEPHSLYLFEKEQHGVPKSKFKPYQTTKSNVHDVEKEKQRSDHIAKYKKWEITAVTPQPLKNPEIKLLSLQDSIELQIKQKEQLEKIQKEHAEQRLLQKAFRMVNPEIPVVKDLNQFFKTYREINESSESESDNDESVSIDSECEVYDQDAAEEKGGVVYTVYN